MEGRFARTALLGFLLPGFAVGVMEHSADPFAAVLPFVVTTLISGALVLELTDQARRRRPGGATWARTDTVIVVVLVVYAAILSANVAFRDRPPFEESATAGCAALYLVLAFCYWRVRRRILSEPG